jgi:hypothetical protein
MRQHERRDVYRVPIVHFCTGSLELWRTDAFNRAQIDPENRLWNLLGTPLWQPLVRQLSHPVHQYLRKHLALDLEQRLTLQLEKPVMKGLSAHLRNCSPKQPLLHHTLATGGWRSHCAWFDYAINELGCSLDVERWSTLSQLIDCGGWLIPTAETIFFLDGPTVLHQDNEGNLHAEGKPALCFADGFSLYAHHGAVLKERYGRCLPGEWQSQWLLEEHDIAICRAMTRVLGYERILAELEAKLVEQDRKTLLYQVDQGKETRLLLLDLHPEPLIQRVPPQARTLKEALGWLRRPTS